MFSHLQLLFACCSTNQLYMEENMFRANFKMRPSFSHSRRNSLEDSSYLFGQPRASFSNNELFKALVSSLGQNQSRADPDPWV